MSESILRRAGGSSGDSQSTTSDPLGQSREAERDLRLFLAKADDNVRRRLRAYTRVIVEALYDALEEVDPSPSTPPGEEVPWPDDD